MGAVVYAVKAEALEAEVEGRLRVGRVWYGLWEPEEYGSTDDLGDHWRRLRYSATISQGSSIRLRASCISGANGCEAFLACNILRISSIGSTDIVPR
jgi:hypothetical protein